MERTLCIYIRGVDLDHCEEGVHVYHQARSKHACITQLYSIHIYRYQTVRSGLTSKATALECGWADE